MSDSEDKNETVVDVPQHDTTALANRGHNQNNDTLLNNDMITNDIILEDVDMKIEGKIHIRNSTRSLCY